MMVRLKEMALNNSLFISIVVIAEDNISIFLCNEWKSVQQEVEPKTYSYFQSYDNPMSI